MQLVPIHIIFSCEMRINKCEVGVRKMMNYTTEKKTHMCCSSCQSNNDLSSTKFRTDLGILHLVIIQQNNENSTQ